LSRQNPLRRPFEEIRSDIARVPHIDKQSSVRVAGRVDGSGRVLAIGDVHAADLNEKRTRKRCSRKSSEYLQESRDYHYHAPPNRFQHSPSYPSDHPRIYRFSFPVGIRHHHVRLTRRQHPYDHPTEMRIAPMRDSPKTTPLSRTLPEVISPPHFGDQVFPHSSAQPVYDKIPAAKPLPPSTLLYSTPPRSHPVHR